MVSNTINSNSNLTATFYNIKTNKIENIKINLFIKLKGINETVIY